MRARLLLLFVIFPIVELWLLIKIGGLIGVIPTIALVLLTALIGSQLVRYQGLTVMARVRAAQAKGEAPATALLDGAALLLAGFMLLTPGFISDTLGFVLLIPRLRQKIARALVSRMVIVSPAGSRPGNRGPFDGGDTIEGEYQRKRGREDGDSDRIGRDD